MYLYYSDSLVYVINFNYINLYLFQLQNNTSLLSNKERPGRRSIGESKARSAFSFLEKPNNLTPIWPA